MGKFERGMPPIASFGATSGRSATLTRMPPIIGCSKESCAAKVGAYCTGVRYSSTPFASVTMAELNESSVTPPVNALGNIGYWSFSAVYSGSRVWRSSSSPTMVRGVPTLSLTTV